MRHQNFKRHRLNTGHGAESNGKNGKSHVRRAGKTKASSKKTIYLCLVASSVIRDHEMPPKFDGIQVAVCFCHFEKVII